ncbi:hypothetical protein BSKO_00644 [Bryopsis sp. KO-2023]|nr:hypothetical protein BSKO_00644 [Bryopsis sp. KO-2023]
MANLESLSNVASSSGVSRHLDRCQDRCATDLITRGIPRRDADLLAKQITENKVQPPVDVEALLEVICVFKTTRIPLAREEMYGGVLRMFSSTEPLYWTFFRGDSGRDALRGVDFERLHEFYTVLQATREEELFRLMMKSIRRILRSDLLWGRGNLPLLMLLVNPLLGEIEFRSMLQKMLKLIRGVSGGAKRDLIRQFALFEQPQMQSILEVLHGYFTIGLYQEPNQQSRLVDVLEVLSLLFEANQDSRVVSHEEFYNTAVNGEVDIEADFRRWQLGVSSLSFCNYPFIYDSGSKSQIMNLENSRTQGLAIEDCLLQAIENFGDVNDIVCPFLVLKVRRGNRLLQDTLDQVHYAKRRNALKRPLKVQFVGEAGVDEGGVAKEFFQLLLRTLFDPSYGMFVYDEDSRLWWFRSSDLDLSQEFELVGVILGLAIFNHHILDLRFPLVVYKKLLGYKPGFEDLHQVFPDIQRSLKQLEEMPNVEDLDLHFEIERDSGFGEMVSAELIPNGANVSVTGQNRTQYIQLYTKYLLETSIETQFTAFRSGFMSVCQSESLKMFLPEELEQAACGKQILDIDALEAATEYHDGYSSSSQAVRWFWEIVGTFSDEKRKKLLSFVTGSDRVPIRGFTALSPKFTISRAGCHSERLPTAHTCFNHLLFPDYRDKTTLARCLNTAIDNAEGFGLM